MRVSYIPGYVIPLPETHPFPMLKFRALRDILLGERLLKPSEITHPHEAPWDVLRLVHTDTYLRKLATGTLERIEERRLGLPWSEGLVRRSRLSVQGTINASRMALEDGIAANLAGGTHHAFPDHGEGFCVLNDVAVAIELLRAEGALQRALIIDLDVHHGNGNAAFFAGDPDTYTFSMHGDRNYPWRRPPSSLDLDLPDETDDDQYLQLLEMHLPTIFDEARPDLVFFLHGVDPLKGDRFGRLALTREGLHARERLVLHAVRERNIPLTLVLAGGYAKTPEKTADLHAIVHREAASIFQSA